MNQAKANHTALYPGTFDPITLGHLDIITRASKLFDNLVVAISTQLNKQPLFSIAERLETARAATTHLSNVRVISFDGLVVECAAQQQAKILVRGLRRITDLEYEMPMAQLNSQLSAAAVETCLLLASPAYMHISASAVREIAYYGGDVSNLVPAVVMQQLSHKRGETYGTPNH